MAWLLPFMTRRERPHGCAGVRARAYARAMDSVEQQVSDKLHSPFLFVWGEEAPPETPTVADPAKVAAYESALRQEMVECLKLLAREVDALRARLGDG
jgi:hypothetical protein